MYRKLFVFPIYKQKKYYIFVFIKEMFFLNIKVTPFNGQVCVEANKMLEKLIPFKHEYKIGKV